jgi:hypothetical protein
MKRMRWPTLPQSSDGASDAGQVERSGVPFSSHSTMKLNRLAFFGLALLLAAPMCGGCHHQQLAWSNALGTKITKNNRKSEEFKKSLAEWLSIHGFVAASDPGGQWSWSGGHTAGEINSWYRGSYHGSPPFLLRVQTVPRKDVDGGFTEFHFSQFWDIGGSDRYVADMEALSKEFKTEFAGWISLGEAEGSEP